MKFWDAVKIGMGIALGLTIFQFLFGLLGFFLLR